FAAEGQITKLAQALNMDAVEIRARNLLHDGDLLSVGTPMPPPVTIAQVVDACARESGYWEQPSGSWSRKAFSQPADPTKRRGVGFACGFKNVGFSFGFPEQSWATIELHGKDHIERVVVRHAGAEVGQGTHTVMVQMTAEAVGVPMEKVELIGHDTA